MKILMAAVTAFALSSSVSFASESQILSMHDLTSMSQHELNSTYANAEPGPMPDGSSEGRAMFFPGSIIAAPSVLLAHLFWQGKVFDRDGGVLVNRVFGFQAIKAELSFGKSLFDGNDSIIIDYHDTSLLFSPVRDEIRLVGPNLYLGRAYARTLLGTFMVVNFALQFPDEAQN